MKKNLLIAALLTTFSLPRTSFAKIEKAIFAGGCFWCMELPFEKMTGVHAVVSGYTGGKKANPTYEEVSSGGSGHIESIQVTYDDKIISYENLLKTFWTNVDPLDANGQFCDKGEQYQSGIFYLNDLQRKLAEVSLKEHQENLRFKDKKIATFLKQASVFYKAEDYHQDYYKKNPVRYKFYRFNCGRDKRLDEVWK